MIMLYLVTAFLLVHGAHMMAMGIIEAFGVVPMDQQTELTTEQKLTVIVIFLSALLMELLMVFSVIKLVKSFASKRSDVNVTPHFTASSGTSPSSPSNNNGQVSQRIHQYLIYPTQKLYAAMKAKAVSSGLTSPSGYAPLAGDDDEGREMVVAPAPILVEAPSNVMYGQHIMVPIAGNNQIQAHSLSTVSMI